RARHTRADRHRGETMSTRDVSGPRDASRARARDHGREQYRDAALRRRVPGTGPAREEAAFDVGAVAAWLRSTVPDAPTVLVGVDLGDDDDPVLPEDRQYTGGASNPTYLLRYPGADLVLRRPPAGTKARGAHDMRREHRV